MTHEFVVRLQRGPMLCDGAMGTQLYALGTTFDKCFESLNLSRPDLVGEIHRMYLEAGADVIETNTFGGNRTKLDEFHLGDKVADINLAAVRIAKEAREAVGRPAFIAGSVGPLANRMAPLGQFSPAEAREIFREQIEALIRGGVDVLILETFSDLNEIEEAVQAAKEVTDLPIIAQMTFTQDGRTPLGHRPEVVARVLRDLEVSVIGVNCSVGPARIMPVVEAMHAVLGEPGNGGPYLSAQPNAGWPENVGGRLMYPATPEYFGNFARRFVQVGARIVGGCCGTTPAHIQAMRLALNALALGPRYGSIIEVERRASRQETPLPPEPPTRLSQTLDRGDFVVAVEVSPPKGLDPSRVLAGAMMLKQEGVDVINVADSPRARMRMSPWAVGHLIQNQVGIETVLHFPTRGRNLLRVQGDLLAAHALHVRNLFVVMGDPPSIGDYPEATDQYDVVPTGLIRLIKHNFNRGVDQAGSSIGRPCSFLVGCALDFAAQDVDREIKLLRKKIEAGADFALTQPLFDIQIARNFLERYEGEHGPLKLPVLAGLLPLVTPRHAEFLHNEVPGITLTETVMNRMRQAGESGGRVEGLRIAQELLLEMKEILAGVYIMPPFGRYDIVAEVIGVLGRNDFSQPSRNGDAWEEEAAPIV